MSNSTQQSLDDLLQELSKARKNFGYPIIVAFDKKTANHVLKQEFIERYSGGLFLDPMNSEVDLEAGVSYHQLNDFCLDEPRLSFENADLSGSKAALMMRTVRGKQIQLSQPVGSTRRRVTRLAEATPVNGPSLVFDIELKNTFGEISDEGRVYFQFIAGENYKFYGGVTQFEIDKLGQHFKQYFEGISGEPEKRNRIEYTLGQIAYSEDSDLKPTRFAIRTHGAPGTKLYNTKSFGDGAVVLFIELENFDSGDAVPPDENKKLPYLLPDKFSSAVMVNQTLLLQNIIFPAFKSSYSLLRYMDWKLMSSPGANDTDYMAGGSGWLPDFGHYWGPSPIPPVRVIVRHHHYQAPTDPNNNNARMRLRLENEKLVFTWADSFTEGAAISAWGETKKTGNAYFEWDIRHEYKIGVDDSSGTSRITLSRVGGHERSSARLDASLIKHWEDFYGHIFDIKLIGKTMQAILDSVLVDADKILRELKAEFDTFILSSLLFKNAQIKLDSAHWPNDILAPGQLAPDRNKFIIGRTDNQPIENGETGVLPAQRIGFKTEPATDGVIWSVRHIPDYDGDNPPGEINPTTGAYTAPAADEFKGTHIKVIVTATKGTEVSHALVSVLRTSVNVYPSIMTVNLNGYADVIAGDMNGDYLDMRLEGIGELIIPISVPLAQRTIRYQAPEEAPKWEPGMPEIDLVMRHSKLVVSTGDTQKVVDILLPVEVEGSYWLVAKAAGTGVKFEFWVRKKNGDEVQVSEEQTSWHVRVGNGTIEKGIYTPDPNKTEEYAVIVAMDDNSFVAAYASMILPLPFIDVEQFLALHAPDEAKVIAGQ